MSVGLVVYALCALTSLLCAAMLLRGFRRTGVRLLLWSALCFACFALNNVLLIVDEHILPSRDLSLIRSLPTLLGIALLLYGLIWESDR
jgi:ABC-type uncharacterized transport system permease subunit